MGFVLIAIRMEVVRQPPISLSQKIVRMRRDIRPLLIRFQLVRRFMFPLLRLLPH